ncbi:MAG TPA: SH3 domain-containing protein [Burkholderiales bacterium]|nr:SH3 domain-containing protein [Burkholderiales bacterium]
MTLTRRLAMALALSLFWALAVQASPATVIRATELKKAPATDADTLAALEENATVQTAERRGGWVQVKTEAGETGWVKFLALRFSGGGAARTGDSGVAQLFNVARGGTSGSQVTTGVRGLDAEDISAAQPNPAAVQRMDSFAVSADEAGRFAAQGPLQAQRVDYPPEQ